MMLDVNSVGLHLVCILVGCQQESGDRATQQYTLELGVLTHSKEQLSCGVM